MTFFLSCAFGRTGLPEWTPVFSAEFETDAKSQRAAKLEERCGFNKALVALAAKQSRILWALLARDQDYAPVEVA